jgi:DNA-binding transcriptional ArsR family regulator
MRTSVARRKAEADHTVRYAEMFGALGTESRLRILRLLLTAHPTGLVAGDIQAELQIPPSTLSHHLERLRVEGLVTVRREGTFLWYAANTIVLEELLGFLFAECCSRSSVVSAEAIVRCGETASRRRKR